MRRLVIVISLCWAVFIVIGCKRKLPSSQTGDNDLQIAVMKLEQSDSSAIYNVRIFPTQELLKADPDISQKMMYQLDSCFYVLQASKKIYADSFEFVANGVPNSFEYLVIFNSLQGNELFYQDKYISKKKYQLTLK